MPSKPAAAKRARERVGPGEPRRLAMTSLVVGRAACATFVAGLVLARLSGNFARPILIYGAALCFACGVAAIVLGYLTRARMRRISAPMDRLGVQKSALRIKAERRSLAGIVMGCFGIVSPLLLAIISAGFFRAEEGYGVNDTQALESLRAVNSANARYLETCQRGFAAKLSELGPPGPGKPADCHAAALIDTALASGNKLGYRFTYIVKHMDSAGRINSYALRADPTIRGITGERSFYADESGVIRSSAKGVATAESGPIE